MIKYPTKNDFPNWVALPKRYFAMILESNEKYLPWHLFDLDNYKFRMNGLKKRFPERTLVPFARHDYSDDIACWELNRPGIIVIIHDYASPGYENRHEFESFDNWFTYINSTEGKS
jgi:hypothetical protein